MRSHPSTTHIDDWSLKDLLMECSFIIHGEDEGDSTPADNFYLTMSDEQRAAKGWPVTLEEMRTFIKANQETV